MDANVYGTASEKNLSSLAPRGDLRVRTHRVPLLY